MTITFGLYRMEATRGSIDKANRSGKGHPSHSLILVAVTERV